MTVSWVIVNIETGEPVLETFSQAIAEKVNAKKYKAVPILEYLVGLNVALKWESYRKSLSQSNFIESTSHTRD